MSPATLALTREHFLPIHGEFSATVGKDPIFTQSERSAIHSGKLGDIVYCLPTCRALGITHLILNVYVPAGEPLRQFPLAAAQAMVPLLLDQPYLRKVTITESSFPLEEIGPLAGVDFNFDTYRNVARHRIGKVIHSIKPKFARFAVSDAPAHLGEHFAAALGIEADLSSPWLYSIPSSVTRESVVISVTQNWRSYPDWYWKAITLGLRHLKFVGHEKEFARAALPEATFLPTSDHRELASVISGAKLFLGTVSFPYAVAEGLKVPRGIEVCHKNLNAFPVGSNGFVLRSDVVTARQQIADVLELGAQDPFRQITRRMRFGSHTAKRFFLRLKIATQPANQSRRQKLRRLAASLAQSLRYGFSTHLRSH